ncbi:HipA family kinase [Stackebrandtia albiflava]|uniref:HipA family kinase n=1 Tax=Stackebrandtia albiflava TaxID=406432 RepID=UPI0011BF9045|nr:HipA family kinase [Stackebrandtia albiflava]
MLDEVEAIRYVTPLREGGSLPGVMEADDLGVYVVKFSGAGQGRRVLVAETICGELGRALGLPVPRLVTVTVDPALGRSEPDQEVQELLTNSPGLNLGMDFLPGSLDFDAAEQPVDAALAGRVLWFDAFTGNVDRTWRNPNMLCWHGRLYLIDHGAALTFHHNWPTADAFPARPYDAGGHALLESSPDLVAADTALAPLVTEELLTEVVAQVPEEWLDEESRRDRYVSVLSDRLARREHWLDSAAAAVRAGRAAAPPVDNRPDWLRGFGARGDRR